MRFFCLLLCGIGFAQTRMIPHLTVPGSGFDTTVIIENTASIEMGYNLEAYDSSGSLVSTKSGQIVAGGTEWHPAESWLGATAAYLKIVHAAEQMQVSVSYQASSGATSPVHVRETQDQSNRFRIFAGNWSEVFDGMAVVNLGSATTDIWVRQRDGQDNLLMEQKIISNLQPNHKALGLIGLPGNTPFGSRTDVVYELESDEPFSVTALRGTLLTAPSVLLWVNQPLALAQRAVQNNDLIIDNQAIVYGNETISIEGNVIIRNGGSLTLNGTRLELVNSFDEEFTVQVHGSSTLEANGAEIVGVNFPTALSGHSQGNENPTINMTDSTVSNHNGVRAFDRTNMNLSNCNIGKLEVHNQCQIQVNGGSELTPHLFLHSGQGYYSGLQPGTVFFASITSPTDFALNLTQVPVAGYHFDLTDNSALFLTDCIGIGVMIHTPGNLIFGEPTYTSVTGVTGNFVIDELGPPVELTNSQLNYLDLDLNGEDKVILQQCKVNRAISQGTSKITLENCAVGFQEIKSLENGEIKIDQCSQTGEFSPSIYSAQSSNIEVRKSDASNLSAKAVDSSRIDFDEVTNLNPSLLTVEGSGQIWIDGVRVQ